MRVELSIKDDRQLRDHIRDCIRGEVTKIAREEIRGFVQQELVRKIMDKDEKWFERTFKEQVFEWIKRRCGAQYYGDKITPLLRDAIQAVAKTFIIPRLEKNFPKLVSETFIKATTEKVIKEKITDALK